MQTIEASLSLLVLLSLSSFLFVVEPGKLDNSLYSYELSADAKNIIYLKGGFENPIIGNQIAMEIFDQTGLCLEMASTDITSYRPEGGAPVPVWVPRRKPLILEMNGSESDFGLLKLAKTESDSLVLGVCKN